MRTSGILLPIASLSSKYGIGSFSKEAYKFVDLLKEAGQNYWQILPLGPTGYGDSPYQSFSTFAGNPYYIDLESLINEGLITEDECNSFDFGKNERYIDYEKIYLSRYKILKTAYRRCNLNLEKEFLEFKAANAFWLKDYCLYMAIKEVHEGESWIKWEEGLKTRQPEVIEKFQSANAETIEFYEFLQYKFAVQWFQLKKYANERNIEIIGDIPIYVALDSADCWANTKLFQFDETGSPLAVAGCPPDSYAIQGQLWGNPLYDWGYHKETGYDWWIKRISYSLSLYDWIRIDHFRGFDEYYSIPYGAITAENGNWEKGPGYEFFVSVERELGKLNVIAEDLGFLTQDVKELVKKTGFAGMKVLQFAFGSDQKNDYLPHNYQQNCIVYTGTHDNDTSQGWYLNLNRHEKNFFHEYLNNPDHGRERIHWDLIRLALGSVANMAIIPVQDYLGLESEARINVPSTLGDNWTWRLRENEITEELMVKIRRITQLFNRN